MTESIHFPEEFIPEIVAMLRRGLVDETNARIKRNTEMQCKELEAYWKRLHEEEDTEDSAEKPAAVPARQDKEHPTGDKRPQKNKKPSNRRR